MNHLDIKSSVNECSLGSHVDIGLYIDDQTFHQSNVIDIRKIFDDLLLSCIQTSYKSFSVGGTDEERTHITDVCSSSFVKISKKGVYFVLRTFQQQELTVLELVNVEDGSFAVKRCHARVNKLNNPDFVQVLYPIVE